MKGSISGSNAALTIFYPFEGTDRESNAMFIVTGASGVAADLLGSNLGSGAGWAGGFRAAAKQNGWKVDAIWFSIEDAVR
jgi:hypothetical protein